MTTQSGDADPSRPQDTATDAIAVRLQRTSSVQAQAAASDLNARPPALQYDNQGRRFYDTAPIPLKRLLGSPLAQAGTFARGPSRERLVGDGWGSPRSFSYDPHVNTNSRHQGLDFFAPQGEPLLCCGDGVVTFVGYQSRQGAVPVEGCKQDSQGRILDAKGVVVAGKDQVGFGGIAVHVKHDGDFQGYRTEYYHMSSVAVKAGQRVSEGQVVGNVGNTGLSIGPHLHFQVAFFSGKTSALVNPTALVPNYRPGHPDSTNTAGGRGVIMPALVPNGVQVAAGQSANVINTLDRGTTLSNQGTGDAKQAQSRYAARVAQIVGVQQTQLQAAAAGFGGSPPVVSAPMTFDFQAGTWSDGRPV